MKIREEKKLSLNDPEELSYTFSSIGQPFRRKKEKLLLLGGMVHGTPNYPRPPLTDLTVMSH